MRQWTWPRSEGMFTWQCPTWRFVWKVNTLFSTYTTPSMQHWMHKCHLYSDPWWMDIPMLLCGYTIFLIADRENRSYTHTQTTPTVLYMLSLNDRKDVGKHLHSSRIICFSKLLGLGSVGRTRPNQVTYGCNRCLDGREWAAYVDKQGFTQLLLKILEILGYTEYIYPDTTTFRGGWKGKVPVPVNGFLETGTYPSP